MKALVALGVMVASAGLVNAGEVVKRDLGVNANGDAIEGYVFQADSSNRRETRQSRRVFRPALDYAYPRPLIVRRETPSRRTTTIYTGPPVIHRPGCRASTRPVIVITR